MGRGLLVVCALSFSLTLRSEAGVCDALLRTGKAAGNIAVNVAKVAGKLAFYPVVAPVQFVRDGVRDVKKNGAKSVTFPFRYLWKDKLYLSAFLTVALATEGTYVSGLEFVQRSSALVPVRLDAPIVVVDGFGTGLDVMRLSATYLEVLGYPHHTNVHVINPRDAAELISELKEIRSKYGQIALMDYVGHGTPSGVLLDGKKLDPAYLPPLVDLFEKGASIRLMNCRVGDGADSEKYLADFGSVFLDQGGHIVASQKYVATGIADLAIVAARAVVAPDSAYPDWVVNLSKIAQSPWMFPYGLWHGVTTESGGAISFIENEYPKLDLLNIDVPRRL